MLYFRRLQVVYFTHATSGDAVYIHITRVSIIQPARRALFTIDGAFECFDATTIYDIYMAYAALAHVIIYNFIIFPDIITEFSYHYSATLYGVRAYIITPAPGDGSTRLDCRISFASVISLLGCSRHFSVRCRFQMMTHASRVRPSSLQIYAFDDKYHFMKSISFLILILFFMEFH